MTPKAQARRPDAVDAEHPYLDGFPSESVEASKHGLTLRPREKTKTRPCSDNTPSETPDELAQLNIADPSKAPHIKAKFETVNVFRRMFPETREEYRARPLQRSSFVAAMHDAGFSVTHCGSSHVIFAIQGGRINIPKPHGVDQKIAQIKSQKYGKRLTKWFGWQRETLVDSKSAE